MFLFAINKNVFLYSGGAGFEPTTFGFGNHYSTKLNYPPFNVILKATPLQETTFKKSEKAFKFIFSNITNLLCVSIPNCSRAFLFTKGDFKTVKTFRLVGNCTTFIPF